MNSFKHHFIGIVVVASLTLGCTGGVKLSTPHAAFVSNPQRSKWSLLLGQEVEIRGEIRFPGKLLPGESEDGDAAVITTRDGWYHVKGDDVRKFAPNSMVVAKGIMKKIHVPKEATPAAQQGIGGVDFDLFFVELSSITEEIGDK